MVRLVGLVQRCLVQYKMCSTKCIPNGYLPAVSCYNISRFSTHQRIYQQQAEEQTQQQQQQQTFDKYKEKSLTAPRHFAAKDSGASIAKTEKEKEGYTMNHPCWTPEETGQVEFTHMKPSGVVDYMAYGSIFLLRKSFDFFSGYTIKKYLGTLDERDWLRRCIFLETVAGVPGFAAAMIRHLHALRRMQRDHGWIHTLLEEAENERMHLMTFLKLRKPGPIFRATVVVSQTLFTAFFSFAYLLSPHFCHRLVGYLEEQAVLTYTCILDEIDAGRLPMWQNLPAPEIAIEYWKLAEDANMKDVILVIRADEAHHREVNHTLGSLDLRDKNPFKPGQ